MPWSIQLPDGRVECVLCPRHCKLADGQRGFCFVRMRKGTDIVLDTYGRSSGFCVDPIEKKPLNHFLPGTSTFSFGTAGCNLGCAFCQNWDISKSRDVDRLCANASPEAIAAKAHELGCRSVAFTYNDPVIFAEYAMDTAKACHARGLATVAVTAGYMEAGPRAEFYAHIDAANVDLKGFTEEFYHRTCMASLQPVLDTLRYLHDETKVWLEVTTLLIPGRNDSNTDLERMTDWFAKHLGPDVPWHFTAFHPDYKMRDVPPTPTETLLSARSLALSKGMHFVYAGNILATDGSADTLCPGCHALLIGRDGYDITRWNLSKGRCPDCGRAIPGRFEDKPGQWGSRRLPVWMG